jgi:hypothetical protein
MHSCIKVTSEDDSISLFTKWEGNLNVLRDLVESMERIKGSHVWVVAHKLGVLNVRTENISKESITDRGRQFIGACIRPCVVVTYQRYPGNLQST